MTDNSQAEHESSRDIVQTRTLEKINYTTIAKFIVLIGVASLAPFFLSQQITGPLVNATLFIATAILGLTGAVMIAIVPSVIAATVGTLPAVLTPMIPFIITGNIFLVLAFYYLKEKNYWLGMVSGSVLKYLFLFGTSTFIIQFVIKSEAADQVAFLMSWPQLITALIGGIIAWPIILFLKKTKQ